MRFSKLFGQTLREPPADSPSAGLALLARAAYLRPPSTLLPLGQSVYAKLTALFENELREVGAQEINPGADIQKLAESEVQSYRQLPRLLYQQAFPGLQLSTLSPSEEARRDEMKNVLESIRRSLASLDLPLLTSHAGSILFKSDQGSDIFLHCPTCDYHELLELAECSPVPASDDSTLPMEKVLTPDCPTIEALAHFLNISESQTAKAVMLMAKYGGKEEFLFVVVRGDTNLSLPKLKRATGADDFYPARVEQIKEAGAEPGYASPIGLKAVRVIVDQRIPVSPNLAAGANEHGYHLLNTNYGRDFSASLVADIASAQTGDPCPECGTPLTRLAGELLVNIEMNHPAPESGSFTNEQGQLFLVWHGQIYIDLFRILLATAEVHHNDKGLTLPLPIAPYEVYLVALPGKTIDTISAANALYDDLRNAGISVLFDDREERAGVKFNDADLIGCPVRITLGERNLQNGMVEFKRRTQPENQLIPLSEVVSHLKTNG